MLAENHLYVLFGLLRRLNRRLLRLLEQILRVLANVGLPRSALLLLSGAAPDGTLTFLAPDA